MIHEKVNQKIVDTLPIKKKKILITGPTSQVGMPVALALVQNNDVWGIARFTNEDARKFLEKEGITCVTADFATSDFSDLPDDFDYVLNFAVTRGGHDDWDRDIASNAEFVALLMARLSSLKGFFHCSTMGVYKYQGPKHKFVETDAIGGINHGNMIPTYPYTKIMAEAVVRAAARVNKIPTTIARLNVPYGVIDSWPAAIYLGMQRGLSIYLHPDRPNMYNPIHNDDILSTIPRMLDVASVPATIVNWGGEQASLEDWCKIFKELTDIEPKFSDIPSPVSPVVGDLTKMHKLIGPTKVTIRDGLKRIVEAAKDVPLRDELLRYFLA
ncbi:MAG: NAD(P)-dependent oxidoreductase [Pseudomonadota bacterium]